MHRVTPEDHELAIRASRYLVTDNVRPAQAARYRPLLTSGPTGDPMTDFVPGMSRQAAALLAGSDLRSVTPPAQVTAAYRRIEGQLIPSHRWQKGLIATALALTEPGR